MNIAIIADDKKKELVTQFCIAYCGILSKHNICATSITGKYISEATGLEIEKLLPGSHGGVQQIASRISYDEVDLLIFMRETATYDSAAVTETSNNILRLCDIHNVPVATNIATAEMLIRGVERGDLDWREVMHAHSGNM
ncbi:MAG: methylglyoxal synthase [Clostridia bacterium]|nr:methylglyoxal synthase [Clostridia bacterium]